MIEMKDMIASSIRNIYARYDALLTVTAVFALVTTVLLTVICFDSLKVEKGIQNYIANGLNARQSTRLSALEEQAGLPATAEIRAAINSYQTNVEAEKQRWLADQERRMAKLREKNRAKAEKERIKKEAEKNTKRTYKGSWSGMRISKSRGSIMGPSGRETYYNLNMSSCVSTMRGKGFSEKKYPYMVRNDGVKTLGGYVMVAANLSIRPKGSFIMTSVGIGIVVDTGGFASRNPTQLDIATNW